jgi:predicted regulator of Ras-like GTPase activity (Roadblock/LC7/MglB family)
MHDSVLTEGAAREIQQTFQQIMEEEPTVIGCLLVGYDNNLVACHMPSNIDANLVADHALKLFLKSKDAASQMNGSQVHQIALETPMGTVVVADFGGGVLVTINEKGCADHVVADWEG